MNIINKRNILIFSIIMLIIISIFFFDKMFVSYSTLRIKVEVIPKSIKDKYQMRYWTFKTYNDAINVSKNLFDFNSDFENLQRPILENKKIYILIGKSYKKTFFYIGNTNYEQGGIMIAIKTESNKEIIKVLKYSENMEKIIL